MLKRLLPLFLLCVSAVLGQGQDSIRAVGGVLTINLVPSSSRYKVFVDQTITSTAFANPINGVVITILFVQDSTGHSVAFGGNIAGLCTVAATASSTTACQFTFDSANNQWTALGAGGIPANTPIAQSQVGPGFNVKNYGAKGDWQSSNNGATTTSNTQTCTDCAFTQADVGKTICGATLSITELPCTTIDVVNSATSVHTVGAATNTFSPQTFAWGTNNDAAITSTVAGAIAASKAKIITGNLGVISATPAVYFPAGGYGICTSGLNFGASTLDGISVLGDGPEQTIIYALTGCNYNTGQGIISFSGSVSNAFLHDLTLDGMNGNNVTVQNSSVFIGASHAKISNVIVQRGSGSGLNLTGSFYGDNVVVVSNAGSGVSCGGCNGEFHNSISSNNGTGGGAYNLKLTNVVGLNNGNGFRWFGGLIDECGVSINGCTQVINSHDVWFIGMAGFGTPGSSCLFVDANSFVHWDGGICGPFGTDNNTGGPTIQAGGVLQASDLRMVSTGTQKCANNSGALQDNGGNTCESQFPIASGTSTGTTAVLTLTNVGAAINTNCTVGDALVVQGAGIAGYNGYYPAGATSGITAVTATTLTYTTSGSNLGALGASGTAYCRNLQTYSGNLPRALLNNPIPNTCYITGTFGATTTAAPMCNFRTQSATNITRVLAASTTSTTCATAPIVTITDGTQSITLTLTSGKSQWDSAVDTSTGVGTTIFKPNGTITLSNTAGTCATPPTNFSVSYNISPILSN